MNRRNKSLPSQKLLCPEKGQTINYKYNNKLYSGSISAIGKKVEQARRSRTRKKGRVVDSNKGISLGFIGKVTFQQRPEGGKDLALQISGRKPFQAESCYY